MPLMQNIVGKLDSKVQYKFARTRIVNGGDNYPAVNQNGLSDRNLPQVKVKRVLKTTDHVPPLPVNSFYGTEHHCAPLFFFQPVNPSKFIRQGQVT